MASSIAPQLEAIGLLPAAARQVSDAYLKAARNLHTACEASLRKAYRKASSPENRVQQEDFQAICKALNDAYAQQTGIWASNAFTSAREVVFKTRTATHDIQPVKEKKPVFNHEYTPLLEKYFEYNAYPSAPDRAILARKSMMTPRQIEVWFQNHRNRARKEGKALRKLSETPLPVDLPLKSLEDKMSFFTVPVDQRKPLNEPKNTSDELYEDLPSRTTLSIPTAPPTSNIDTLDPPRPPCAFPAAYTPSDVNLFSTQPGVYKFPPPLWYRKPAMHTRLPQIRMDMNEFVLEFSQKLHLRAPASKSQRSHPSQSWCAGRYIPWCPAPHPALIRSAIAFPTLLTPTERLQEITASISFQHTFGSLLPTTLRQASLATPTPRKTAGLPKRVPKRKSLAHRPNRPAISESSSEPVQLSTSGSRIPSITSDITDRRPSSSSSSSSSSYPTTPVLSASALPGDTDSIAISVSGVDFDFVDDFVNNTSKIPSPDEKLIASSVATQPKQHFAFGFDTHVPENHLHRLHNSPS